MKKFYSTIMLLAMMVAALGFTACGGDDDEEDEINLKQDYDILQINGKSYACYGYRCAATFSSSKDRLLLPCGELSDAQQGEYNYDYMYEIGLEDGQNLKKGSKLEDFSPILSSTVDYYNDYDYSSGSATILDMTSKYITVKFDSFRFGNGSKSYTFNGTVQLDLD